MIGDFKQIGIALFFIVMSGVIIFYLIERYWLSEKVEEASPETLHKIEEKLHDIEGVAQHKLHDLSERLHLTRDPQRPDKEFAEPQESSKAAKK